MNPCGSFGYTARQGATLVALISCGYYILQLIMVCILGAGAKAENGETHQIVTVSEEEYYVLGTSHTLMIFMSVLLFVGVRYRSVSMILPWIVLTSATVAEIAYFSLMVANFMFTMTKFHVQYLSVFIEPLIHFTILTYLLWIVIYFMLEIRAQPADSAKACQERIKDIEGSGNEYRFTVVAGFQE